MIVDVAKSKVQAWPYRTCGATGAMLNRRRNSQYNIGGPQWRQQEKKMSLDAVQVDIVLLSNSGHLLYYGISHPPAFGSFILSKDHINSDGSKSVF